MVSKGEIQERKKEKQHLHVQYTVQILPVHTRHVDGMMYNINRDRGVCGIVLRVVHHHEVVNEPRSNRRVWMVVSG